MNKGNNDVFLVFRAFTTGCRLNDPIFGIAYSVFDTRGSNYGSDLLTLSLASQEIEPFNVHQWRDIWLKNHWSVEYFDKVWAPHIPLLNRIQDAQSINCGDPTEILQKFYKMAVEAAFNVSKTPIIVDVHGLWNLICSRVNTGNEVNMGHILCALVVDFRSFAVGVSRSSDLCSLEQYQTFFDAVVCKFVTKIDTKAIDASHPEIYIHAQHILYIHDYLKQSNLLQIVQTPKLMIGLFILGIILGFLISLFF